MCAFVLAVAIGDGMAVFDAVFKYADISVSFLTDAGDDEIFLGDKTDTGQFVVSEFI